MLLSSLLLLPLLLLLLVLVVLLLLLLVVGVVLLVVLLMFVGAGVGGHCRRCSADAKAALQATRSELTESKSLCQSLRSELNELRKDVDSTVRAAKSAEQSVVTQDTRLQRALDEVRSLTRAVADRCAHVAHVLRFVSAD
jgi:septal ring factor EnvC (AmiA/AmiB activator)